MKRRVGRKLFSFLLAFLLIFSELGSSLRIYAQDKDEATGDEAVVEAEEVQEDEAAEPEEPAQPVPEDDTEEETETDGDPEVEHYGVWVGGTEITSKNCDNIPNLVGGTGKLQVTKVGSDFYGFFLILDGVTGINGGYDIGSGSRKALIYTTDMVQLMGNSTLTNDNGPVIYAEHDVNCTITIRGKHTLKGGDGITPAIEAKNGFISIAGEDTELTILNDDRYDGGYCLAAGKDITFEKKTGKVNISGRSGIAANKIKFEGGDVTIKSTGTAMEPVTAYGSDDSDIVFDNTEIVNPVEGKVKSNGKSGSQKIVTITDKNGTSVSEVRVMPTPEKYGVWVGDQQITSLNKDNIPNLLGTDASGSFDPDNRVLNLQNVTGITGSHETPDHFDAKIYTTGAVSITGDAKIANPDGPVVYADDMQPAENLLLEGTFDFSGKKCSIIYAKKNIVLRGHDSKITVNADNTYCVTAEDGFVSILDGEFSFTGSAGVASHNGKITMTGDIDFDINNTYSFALVAWGTEGGINLGTYSAITSPAKAEIVRQNVGESTELVTVVDPDSGNRLVKLHVGRKPEDYDLWVGDVQINSANKDNIPNLKDGTGTYNPNTHTLTLNGVTGIMGRHSNAMISTEMAGTLTIDGSARLSNYDGSVISVNCDLTLKGDLDLYSDKSHTVTAGSNFITVDGKLQAKAGESTRYALYTFGSAGGVKFKGGRTSLSGKGGVFSGGDINFDGGELSIDVSESAFTISKSKDLIFAEGYGFIEPDGAYVGDDPENSYAKTSLNADGAKAKTVRLGQKSDIGLFIGFDDTDTVLSKDAEGKYTAVYTGAAIKPEVLVKNNGRVLVEGVDYKLRYSKNVKVGTATVTVSGKGNYTKKRVLSFDIKQKDLTDPDVVIGNLIYQKGKKPAPTVAYKGVILKVNKDYTAEVSGDQLTLKGKGNFTGTLTVTVTEKEADAYKNAKVKLGFKPEAKVYNGAKRELSFSELTVTSPDGINLMKGTDYDVSYSANVNAGTVKLVVVAKGMWNGVFKKTYKILPNSDAAINVYGLNASYSYNKKGVKPSIEVKADSVVLKQGRDYKITYKSNKKLGTGSFTLKFLGNYKGASYGGEKTFKIEASKPDPHSSVKVIVGDMVFKKTGKYQPAVKVIVYGRLLSKKDLSIEYAEKDALTEAKNGLTLTASGKGNYDFTKAATYNVLAADSAKDVSKAKVKLVQGGKTVKKVAYTGKEISFSSAEADAPQLSVNIGGTVLSSAEIEANFDIYYADNIEKGKATVILKAKAGSGYAGVCSGTFTITSMSLDQK
ncbi:MAG: hypothetical protein IK115_01375 [Lachnospiraceae bacterium]|nr:hypothetical protein [Lachnospiraceae bacterium]